MRAGRVHNDTEVAGMVRRTRVQKYEELRQDRRHYVWGLVIGIVMTAVGTLIGAWFIWLWIDVLGR